MAYKIHDNCVKCGSCEPVCPVGAITEGDTQFKIDPETCIHCGTCEPVCPVEAIHPDE